MQNIVISLRSAEKRREHITNEFSNKNVNFEFFDALTPDLAQSLAKKMNLNVQDEFLSQGELACFMSHVSIWQKMLDENIPYLAVFEDDVYLGENAAQIFNDFSWIRSDWHIIKTEMFNEKLFFGKESYSLLSIDRDVKHLVGKNLGTAGYILSLEGAKAYLNYIQKMRLIPLDQLMFSEFIANSEKKVYQLSPAICIQEMILFPNKKADLLSDLLVERNTRMKKNKKKGWLKIQKEFFRIINQLKNLLMAKKIEFK